MLAAALHGWSELMENRNDLERAKLYVQQAIVNEQQALQSEPLNAGHRKTLEEYQGRLDMLNQLPETPVDRTQ